MTTTISGDGIYTHTPIVSVAGDDYYGHTALPPRVFQVPAGETLAFNIEARTASGSAPGFIPEQGFIVKIFKDSNQVTFN